MTMCCRSRGPPLHSLAAIKGATSFSDMKIFEGQAGGTYKEACATRGLLDDNKMHDEILAEAVTHMMPCQLQHTFAILLLWDEPAEPHELWQKYASDMAEDFLHQEHQVTLRVTLSVMPQSVLCCGEECDVSMEAMHTAQELSHVLDMPLTKNMHMQARGDPNFHLTEAKSKTRVCCCMACHCQRM